MIRSIFKISLRHLWRQKLNSFIIIISLTIAFAFSNTLITFIIHELKTDSFHDQSQTIYRVKSSNPFGEGENISHISNSTIKYISDNYPEVEDYCLIANLKNVQLVKEDIVFDDLILLTVDSSFFKFFNFHLSQGSQDQSIRDGRIILTEKIALNLGYDLNQEVVLKDGDQMHLLEVSGIVDEPQENSHLKFDGIIMYNNIMKQWGANCYVKLNENSDPSALTTKINGNDQVPSLIGPGGSDYFFQPLQEVYFDNSKEDFISSRDKQLLWISGVVIFIILFIASFNFLNLVLISMLNRKKSIGIQKVFGITKSSIAFSAFIEILLYVISAVLLSLVITFTILPYFNMIFQAQISPDYFNHWQVILILGGLIGIVAVVMGVYLSHALWKLKTMKLISIRSEVNVKINRFILSAQFFITVGLIICSAIIIKQMKFIENAPLGFNRYLVQVNLSDQEKKQNLAVLKQKISSISGVGPVSLSSGNPISGNWKIRYELENDKMYSPYLLSGDIDLINTLHLNIIEGAPYPEGKKNAVLVNETLVKQFAISVPIGSKVPGTKEDYIVGVVKDFQGSSLRDEIPPYIIRYETNPGYLLIDYSDQDLAVLLPEIEASWRSIFPDEVFSYSIINDELTEQHQTDYYFYRLVLAFTVASVLISCFGLFALSWGYSKSRTKEIGIRKVNGASVFQIFLILFRRFVYWIGFAFVLAAPVAYWLTQKWLQDFTYKTEIDWKIFTLAGGITLIITFITVSFQTLKASLANPIKYLGHE